jgi:hypothetical protein
MYRASALPATEQITLPLPLSLVVRPGRRSRNLRVFCTRRALLRDLLVRDRGDPLFYVSRPVDAGPNTITFNKSLVPSTALADIKLWRAPFSGCERESPTGQGL